MENQLPLTLEELKKKLKPIKKVISFRKREMTKMNKVGVWITDHVGTMGFFMIIFTWTVCWLSWNTLAPKELRFDPFPAFVLWLFLSNMIQIFLMPLIMIGQNQQSAEADARAEADYEINKKAELEIETILLHLENQNRLILQILQRIEKGQ